MEGRLTFNSWTAQDGTKRSKHRVTVENFQFLGAPSDAGKTEQTSASSVEPSIDEASPPDARRASSQVERETGADDIPF